MDSTKRRDRSDTVSGSHSSSDGGRDNVDSMDLSSRTVMITGASRGLGKGMAEWFRDRGAAVGASARTEPEIAGEGVLTGSVDVTNLEAIQRFTRELANNHGPIDLWVNNAGIADPISQLRDLDYAGLEDHFRVNVGGVHNGTRSYLHHLEETDHTGALVNISSGAATRGMAGAGAYCAGKAAVDRLTETVTLEEPDRLRVVLALSPGIVDTDMQVFLRNQDGDVLNEVDMYRRFEREGNWNSPAWVAEHMAHWVFENAPDEVIVRVPAEG